MTQLTIVTVIAAVGVITQKMELSEELIRAQATVIADAPAAILADVQIRTAEPAQIAE